MLFPSSSKIEVRLSEPSCEIIFEIADDASRRELGWRKLPGA